jgi:hypothetical protein
MRAAPGDWKEVSVNSMKPPTAASRLLSIPEMGHLLVGDPQDQRLPVAHHPEWRPVRPSPERPRTEDAANRLGAGGARVRQPR